MTKIRKNDILIGAGVLLLIFLAMFIRYVNVSSYLSLIILRSLIYIGLFSAWCFSIRKRIIQTQVKHYLTVISALMIVWLLFRTVKFCLSIGDVARHLWYLYYIPMLFIPLFSLFVANSLGKPENFKLPGWMRFLYIPTALLFLLVITNDLHQFVFSFPSGVFSDENYVYELGYYLVVVWEFICAACAICVILAKCRIPYSKTYLCLPLVPFIILLLYCFAYVKKIYWVRVLAGDLTVSLCIFIAATFECCIQCGLIQSNIGYEDLFESTTIRIHLADSNFNIYRNSASASTLLKEDMQKAVNGTVRLDKNTLLKCHRISSGFVFWQEDISEITNVTEQLMITQEELRDTGDILKAENEQRALQLHLSEENRLYDLIEEKTSHQIAVLSSLLEKLKHTDDISAARKILGKIVVIGTYIKRRSNLIFVLGQKRAVSFEELRLCLNESAANLKLCGTECKTSVSFFGKQPDSEKIIMIYDLFEAVAEQSLDSLSSLLLFAESVDGRFSVNICAACKSDLSLLKSSFPFLKTEQDDDGIWYLTLSEGGEPA